MKYSKTFIGRSVKCNQDQGHSHLGKRSFGKNLRFFALLSLCFKTTFSVLALMLEVKKCIAFVPYILRTANAEYLAHQFEN